MKFLSNRKNDINVNGEVFDNDAKKKQLEIQEVLKSSENKTKALFISFLHCVAIIFSFLLCIGSGFYGVYSLLKYSGLEFVFGIVTLIAALCACGYLIYISLHYFKVLKEKYNAVIENEKHIKALNLEYLKLSKTQIVEASSFVEETKTLFNDDGSINLELVEDIRMKEYITSLLNENNEMKQKLFPEEVKEEVNEENVNDNEVNEEVNEEEAIAENAAQSITITFDPNNADNIVISKSGEIVKGGENAIIKVNNKMVPSVTKQNEVATLKGQNSLTSRFVDDTIACFSSGEKYRDLKDVDNDIKKNDQQNKVYRIMFNVGLLLICFTLPLFLIMLIVDQTVFNGTFPVEYFLGFYLLANVIFIVGNVASLITRNKNENLMLEKRLIEEDNSGEKIFLTKGKFDIPEIVESKAYRGEIKEKETSGIWHFLYILFFAIWETVILAVLGSALCCTIVGIPAGVALFKFIPNTFKIGHKKVVLHFKSHPFLNTVSFIFGGFETYLITMALGLAYFTTIIGIPIALEIFKFAPYFLAPFGSEILEEGTYSESLDSVNDLSLLLKGVMQDDRDVILSNGLNVKASEAMRLVLDKDEKELLNGYAFNSLFGSLFNKFWFTLPTKVRAKDKYKSFTISRKLSKNTLGNYLGTLLRTYYFIGLIYGAGLVGFITLLNATGNTGLSSLIISKVGFNGIVFLPLNGALWPIQIGLYLVIFPFIIYSVIIAILGCISHYAYRYKVNEIFKRKWKNLVSYYPIQDDSQFRVTSMNDKISFANKKNNYIKGRSLRDVIRDIID